MGLLGGVGRITLLAAACTGCLGTVRAGVVSVDIDNNTPYQTMEGFGATHLSLMYEQGDGTVADYPGAALRALAIDAVYNQVRLTTGNVEGPILETPAGYNERANDDGAPFNYNWSGFGFTGADATVQNMITPAQPGFDNYYLAPKINVRWSSPWLADIRAADYDLYLDECAEQVLAAHIYWRDTYGIVPQYCMLFNEALSGNVELWPGSPQEVVDIIKRTGARLRSEGFADILFVVAAEETEQGSLVLATTILSDPAAAQYVGAIGFHPYPYGSTYSGIANILAQSGTGNPDAAKVAVRNQLRDLGAQYSLPVWMTEVSNGGVDPRSFDDLRGRAIHIHDELIYADAAAYFGMNSMWDLQSQVEHFGNSDLFGNSSEGTVVLIDQSHKEVIITGMGYAIGHYARWIDRGAVRIEAATGDPLVQVTAFRDDGRGHLVLVAINNAPTERTLEVNLSGLELAGDLTGEQSTAAAYWQTLVPFPPASATSFTVTLPAESVTSLAASFGGPAGVPTISQWGLVVMTLLSLTAGTIIAGRQSRRGDGCTKQRAIRRSR
jgi:O-glycosyl hydrolase